MSQQQRPRKGLIHRFWRWVTSGWVAQVEEDMAVCEFDCRKPQCFYGEWSNCERRIRGITPRDELKPPHKVEHCPHHRPAVVIHQGPAHRARPDRIRRYLNVNIARPYGHLYPGFGWFRADDDAFKWLSFTAITLKILDNLNEEQQREHEAAQVKATEAQVGETIAWNKEGASGNVTVLRDGTSTTGRYCREFQQEVTIGGKQEQALGTACRNPDGSWEVVSTSSSY